jgi:hypothetical protein
VCGLKDKVGSGMLCLGRGRVLLWVEDWEWDVDQVVEEGEM